MTAKRRRPGTSTCSSSSRLAINFGRAQRQSRGVAAGLPQAVDDPPAVSPVDGSQLCTIGYFAKISSARLNALSIAASGAIPLIITSASATLKTCSALTWAIAGLKTS